MSQIPPSNPELPPNLPNPAAVPQTTRRRPASVQLRESGEGGVDLATLMDPATKSLADALKITYRILQLGMVVLLVVFLFSGVQSVRTGEKGVQLFNGRIEDADIPPGIKFTLPAPFGELVTVPTGLETVKLEGEFWPRLSETDMRKSPEELKGAPRGKLDPATDGSIITADGSLAHARFAVSYRRENVKDYLAVVADRDTAERLVRAAVMRGVVHAAASVSIDEFLSDRADKDRPESSYRDIAATAKLVAQKTLDDMKSGIQLQDLSIQDRTPPIDVIKDFQQVQTEDAKATQVRNAAQEDRAKTLSAAGGQNAENLLRLIDHLDEALTKKDDASAASALATIDDMLDGKPVKVDGVEVRGIGGRASGAMSSAREYRSSVVSRAQADAALFEVKLDSFRKNPGVMITGEWTAAFRKFLSQKNVEVIQLPLGTTTIALDINPDPTLRRLDAIRRQEIDAAKKRKQDEQELEKRKFSTEKKPTTYNAE